MVKKISVEYDSTRKNSKFFHDVEVLNAAMHC